MDPNAPVSVIPTPLPPPIPSLVPPPAAIVNPSDPGTPDSINPKKNFIKILIIVFFIMFIFLSIGVGLTFAVAYEKLDVKNPKLQSTISYFVIGLPFTPKTPKYLLSAAAMAHQKINSQSFDLSIATKTDQPLSFGNLSEIDIQVKGDVDYKDPKNVLFGINASVTKDFNFDFKKIEKNIYFKINKIPPLILTTFGFTDEEKVNKILENWVVYDTSPLDTEARKSLDQKSEDKSITADLVQKTIESLLDEKILMSIKISEDKVDEFGTYKLALNADKDMIMYILSKLEHSLSGSSASRFTQKSSTETISDFVFNVWTDKNDHFIRKIEFSFKISVGDPSQYMTSYLVPNLSVASAGTGAPIKQTTASIVGVAKLSDFGKQIDIVAPQNSIKFEDYYKQLFMESSIYNRMSDASSSAGLVDVSETQKRSRDAARLTDLANLQQAINVTVQEATRPGASIFCANTGFYPCFGKSTFPNSKNSNGLGWIKVNIGSQKKSVSVSTLPVDPINDSTHHYSYCANADSWEIDTVLESSLYVNKMVDDGGDDLNKYEVGSSLTLMGKAPGCNY